jgi:hypothetical protein
MANLYNPRIARGLTRSGKIVVAEKSHFDDHRLRTSGKGSHREALREAITFANFVETHEVYIHKAMELGTTPYNLAITDWFGAPRVLEIDVDGWTGEIGQPIRVKARDNVMVARVTVVIRDLNENVLETGEAVSSAEDDAWWIYTTQSRIKMTPFPTVEAIAEDLPGNTDSFAIS